MSEDYKGNEYIEKIANELEKRNKNQNLIYQFFGVLVLGGLCFAFGFLVSYGWHLAQILSYNKFGG